LKNHPQDSLTTLTPYSEPSVLVVDDEAFARQFFKTILKEERYQCIAVDSAKACFDHLKDETAPDLIILDVRLPDGDGIQILDWIRKQDISVPVIIITAYGSISDAVHAMKVGAYDFFTKPFEDTNKLKISIKNALELGKLSKENILLRTRLQSQSIFQNIIGKSLKMQKVYEMIEKAAKVASNILIEGKTGTGKDLVAKAIHDLSSQSDHAFIPVNCAALPETLLESALFGYEKGAFTGAIKTTPGFFEEANKGTLFLDEIGEAPASVQVKILRAVEAGSIFRVGRTKPIHIQVRLIFATNKDLGKEVAEERFRSDLYYRINTIRINLPPLRQRKEDIPLLVNHFLDEYCRESGIKRKYFEDQALHCIIEREWPGNVRELKNFVEKVVALHSNTAVSPKDLEKYFEESISDEREALFDNIFEVAKKDFERRYFNNLIARSGGDLTLASNYSGIHLATIYRKIKALGIEYK